MERALSFIPFVKGAPVLIVFLLLLLSGPNYTFAAQTGAQSNEVTTLTLSPQDALNLVSRLILAGKLADASAVLTQIRNNTGNVVQEQFLTAQIAIRLGNYDEALSIYSALLQRDPSLTRIRIERARLLFALGNQRQSNKDFQVARQSALTAGALAYIDRYLIAIRQRQPWTAQLYLSGLYDTNVSAGPDQETVTLFGLPFTLSDEAREQAAVGAALSASGSYRWRLSEDTDLRFAGGLRHVDVEGGPFDDTLVSGQLGSSFVGDSFTVSGFATGYRRWFGGTGLSRAIGGQGIVQYRFSGSARLAGILSVQSVDYDLNENRSGTISTAILRGIKSLNSDRAISFYSGVIFEDSQSAILENTTYRVGGTLINRWSSGVRLSFRPEIAYRKFAALQPAFAEKRSDWRLTMAIDLSGPRIEDSLASPFVSYTYTSNDSNIEFNSFSRHQVRAGISFTF